MKNVLIIGSGNTGCKVLAMMNDYHTVFYRAVQEGIKIVTVEQIELGKRVKQLSFENEIESRLSFIRNTLLPDPIVCLDYSFAKTNEFQQKDRRQQHKWAVRNYRK